MLPEARLRPVRVIAGIAKGRRLVAPKGLSVRPLTDRAKEALFSWLGDVVVEARVLDLYAGSGSLGIEALSRGAGSVVFVEQDRRAIAALRGNLETTNLAGDVVRADVSRFLEDPRGAFDVVFVDPPYALSLASVETVLTRLGPVLAVGGVVVLHRRFGGDTVRAPVYLTLEERRRYGDAELWRYTRRMEEEL